MKNLGIEGGDEVFGGMSSEAAATWSKNLTTIAQGGVDTEEMHTSLMGILEGRSTEEIDSIMAQINAVDMSSIDSWESLKNTFEDLGIQIAED
jgi:hypothetical protein